MPTNKRKKKANSEAALALGGRPKRGVMAVTTTTTLRSSVRGVAPTAPAASVTVPGGAAPAVAAAATDRTSSWCNTIAGSRPSINTGHNLNIHDAALQIFFQADACHMKFGKYMLYSCYGTTANGNTSSVAFGILFGNEDKEGWVQF